VLAFHPSRYTGEEKKKGKKRGIRPFGGVIGGGKGGMVLEYPFPLTLPREKKKGKKKKGGGKRDAGLASWEKGRDPSIFSIDVARVAESPKKGEGGEREKEKRDGPPATRRGILQEEEAAGFFFRTINCSLLRVAQGGKGKKKRRGGAKKRDRLGLQI